MPCGAYRGPKGLVPGQPGVERCLDGNFIDGKAFTCNGKDHQFTQHVGLSRDFVITEGSE